MLERQKLVEIAIADYFSKYPGEGKEDIASEIPNEIIENASPPNIDDDLWSLGSASTVCTEEARSAEIKAETVRTSRNIAQPRMRSSRRAVDKRERMAAIDASPYKQSSFAAMTFEAFRAQHRIRAQSPIYRPSNLIQESKEDADTEQPYHEPLTSRYDWRLRAPSQSALQKAIYGGKASLRYSKRHTMHASQEAGLEAYQARYSELVQLEREEEELQALERLRRRLVVSSGYASTRDTLVGLEARLQPTRAERARRKAEATAQSEFREPATSSEVATSPTRSKLAPAEKEEYGGAEALEATFNPDKSQLVEIRQDTDKKRTVSFNIPTWEDFSQETDFRRGKMVFIWKCARKSNGELYVPELSDSKQTLAQLKSLPARGIVSIAYTNRIDVVIDEGSGFRPDESALYR